MIAIRITLTVLALGLIAALTVFHKHPMHGCATIGHTILIGCQ